MAESVYTKVRKGELPGEIIYQDEICFAILSIQPNNPGHTLVIPTEEVEQWILLDKPTLNHCVDVAQAIAKVQARVYKPVRVVLTIAGLDVDHAHIHIFPVYKPGEADHSAAKDTSPQEMAVEADKLRAVIAKQGGLKL
ncbi:HIT family protein [Candidatus Saccharibacteria bacterium]|nr:HIT family protein [Candidatus Saccharibacteria bacterium]